MPSPSSTYFLQIDRLECQRGGNRLFKGLSAHIESGMLLRVEGKNGAGKTTLLRTLCGLSRPSAGGVFWCGRSIFDQSERYHHQMIYLGHTPALKEDLSAIENLESAWGLSGARPLAPGLIQEALSQSGLSGREHLPVKALSQGQRKRVTLARLVLAINTPLWILDEPLNALDTSATPWFMNLLSGHLQRGGLIVLTSHQAVPWPTPPRQIHITL